MESQHIQGPLCPRRPAWWNFWGLGNSLKFGLLYDRNKADLNAVLRNVKALFSKHPWLCAGGFASFLAVCSVAVHPFGTPKQVVGTPKQLDAHELPAAADLKPPLEVAAVFERSCMDCHSNHTVWPWYSYVAPVSWLVERDVHAGRDHMNLSEWHRYTIEQKQKLFADIATAVKNRAMPLPQYTLLHRHAQLSDAETDIVYGWARAERRKLKAAFNSPVLPGSNTETTTRFLTLKPTIQSGPNR